MISFSTDKLRKKAVLDHEEVCFYFQLLRQKNLLEELVKQIGENILWIHYIFQLLLFGNCPFD